MQSSQQYFRSLNLIYWSLFIFQLVALGITVWLLDLERDDDYDFHYMIADFVLMIICFSLSFFVPRKRFKSAQRKLGLREKLTIYKGAMIIRWVLILLISFFSIFSFIMTKENIFICATIFSLVVYFLKRPTIKIACEHLRLSDREERILRNPESAI